MSMPWERAQTVQKVAQLGDGRVMILIPHRSESGYREWEDWWRHKLKKPPNTGWLEQRGVSLTTNRTGLVREALKTDANYFLFLDDDVIGPDDMLLTLLSYKLPIVCGLYMAKKKKEERALAAWMRSGSGYAPIALEQPARMVQVDTTGLGAALIHRSVFERVPQPWFVWEWDGVSEDFYFFERVNSEIGVKPIIDMECKMWHIGLHKVFTDGTFTTLEM